MNIACRIASTLALLLCSFTFTKAEEVTSINAVHLVVAADLSSSMHIGASYLSHANLQADGLVDFFANYQVNHCDSFLVDFAPWGDVVHFPVRQVLQTNEDAQRFAYRVKKESGHVLGGTAHNVGLKNAMELFRATQARQQILIFTTDGLPAEIAQPYSQLVIPDNVVVYGISFGTEDVHAYVEKFIVPTNGRSYPVKTSADLVTALKEIFDEINFDPCLG